MDTPAQLSVWKQKQRRLPSFLIRDREEEKNCGAENLLNLCRPESERNPYWQWNAPIKYANIAEKGAKSAQGTGEWSVPYMAQNWSKGICSFKNLNRPTSGEIPMLLGEEASHRITFIKDFLHRFAPPVPGNIMVFRNLTLNLTRIDYSW